MILDTETTGLKSDDRICQLAFKCNNEIYSSYFNPMKEMTKEAQEVNKIDEEMLKTCVKFEDSIMMKILSSMDSYIVVAHFAQFDIGMLAKENIIVKDHICTKTVAKWLYPKFKSHRLQDLKIELNIIGDFDAHNAVGDVFLLEKVTERMIDDISKKFNCDREKSIEKMISITKK